MPSAQRSTGAEHVTHPGRESASGPELPSAEPVTGRRTFVLDTSVLLSDPRALLRFAEHEVVLPVVVITELEAKRRHPELGYFAREALRLLDDLRVRHGRLDMLLPLHEEDGGTLRVELNHADPRVLPAGFRLPDNDTRILAVVVGAWALLTTASQRDNTGQPISTDTGGVATALDYGSGHVTPNAAADPGLAYDSNSVDWVRFLCGVGQLSATSSTCTTYGRIDPSDLNAPNIAIGALAGSQTVTRTVTNVAEKAADYSAVVQAPAGVATTVTPTRLKLSPGAKGTFQVTFTRTAAAFDRYALGALTWTDGKHQVRSQLAVRPVVAAAPAEVAGTGTAGSAGVQVIPGFAGTLTASAAGLVPADRLTATLSPTGPGFSSTAPAVSARTAKFSIGVPTGTAVARQSTFDRDFAAGTDVDIYLYRAGTATLVASSGGSAAQEQIQLLNPAAGMYDLYVVLFGAAPGQSSVQTPAFSWALGDTAAGNLTVQPASQAVQPGQAAPVTAAWSGLTAGQRYLGRISFGDGTASAGGTFVRVDA